jgi:hypothetical protein
LVEWEAYLAGLTFPDRARAEGLAEQYGQEAATRRVRYHPAGSLDDLAFALRKDRERVRTKVAGLYESIDANQPPVGWSVSSIRQREPDGTWMVQSDVIGPNGAMGFFERGYNPGQQRIELRNAFLRHRGMTDGLPGWVTGVDVPMVPTRGTPTVHYFTLYQLKLLGVAAGTSGVVNSIKMCTIQNVEAILHLHWLRQRYPDGDLGELVAHTVSVEYAETTAVQCGNRLLGTKFVATGECESEIGGVLDHYEDGNPQRRAENDELLAGFSLNRRSVVKWNFGIDLSVVPV